MATRHAEIIHALTDWDRRQEKRDRHHNRYFLPIAFKAIENAETEYTDTRTIILAALTGRCCDFVLKSLDLPLMTAQEARS